MSRPRYPAEEIARRGEEIYEREIRARVEPDHRGKVVVIDIESGDYELDDDHLAAVRRARARNANAELYALRVGYPALGRIGGRLKLFVS
jgi:hypothetical protein